jgi:hypothetical protein
MILPVKFPSDIELIAEESARFRALSSKERMQAIIGILDAGELMLQNSPSAEFLKQYAEAQELAAKIAIQEFIARHVNR